MSCTWGSSPKPRNLISAVLAVGLLAGCESVIRSHGYTPLPEQLARIEVGVDTRGSVQRKIGRPSKDSIFSDEAWYYVSSTVEERTYHEAEVIDRKVVAIRFDENDLVAGVNRYGLQDGRVIDLETRTTPTYGRQLTIIEQLIGNLGAVRGEQVLGDD